MSIAGVAACNDRIWTADTGACEFGDDRLIIGPTWKAYPKRDFSKYETSSHTRTESAGRSMQ